MKISHVHIFVPLAFFLSFADNEVHAALVFSEIDQEETNSGARRKLKGTPWGKFGPEDLCIQGRHKLLGSKFFLAPYTLMQPGHKRQQFRFTSDYVDEYGSTQPKGKILWRGKRGTCLGWEGDLQNPPEDEVGVDLILVNCTDAPKWKSDYDHTWPAKYYKYAIEPRYEVEGAKVQLVKYGISWDFGGDY